VDRTRSRWLGGSATPPRATSRDEPPRAAPAETEDETNLGEKRDPATGPPARAAPPSPPKAREGGERRGARARAPPDEGPAERKGHRARATTWSTAPGPPNARRRRDSSAAAAERRQHEPAGPANRGAAKGAPLASPPTKDEEKGLGAGAATQPQADANKCVVCLEDLGEHDTRILECRHGFHVPCIDTWEHGYRKNTCPTCRDVFRKPFPRTETDVNSSWDLGEVEDDWDDEEARPWRPTRRAQAAITGPPGGGEPTPERERARTGARPEAPPQQHPEQEAAPGDPDQEAAGADAGAGARAASAEAARDAAEAANEAWAIATAYGATNIGEGPAWVQELIDRRNAANRAARGAERARRALRNRREDEERQERRIALILQRQAEPPGGSTQDQIQGQVPAQATDQAQAQGPNLGARPREAGVAVQPRERPQPRATITLATPANTISDLEREHRAAANAEHQRSAARGMAIIARRAATPHEVDPLTTRATASAYHTVTEGAGLSFPFLHSHPGDNSLGVQLTRAIRTGALDANLTLGTVLVHSDRQREERQWQAHEGQGDHSTRVQERLDMCRAEGSAAYSRPDTDYMVSLTIVPHLGHGLTADQQAVWMVYARGKAREELQGPYWDHARGFLYATNPEGSAWQFHLLANSDAWRLGAATPTWWLSRGRQGRPQPTPSWIVAQYETQDEAEEGRGGHNHGPPGGRGGR